MVHHYVLTQVRTRDDGSFMEATVHLIKASWWSFFGKEFGKQSKQLRAVYTKSEEASERYLEEYGQAARKLNSR
jgi:hypothetical protein